jgi:hypothetical protein
MVEILIYQNILRKGFKGRYLRVEIESATINSLQRRPYFGNNYPLPSNGSTKSYFHITKYKKLLSKSQKEFTFLVAKSAMYNGYNTKTSNNL